MTAETTSRRTLAALCTLALALAIRLHALGRPSLWFDELLEVERATGPWRTLLFGRPIDHDPPLFALALRGWIAVGRLIGWPWLGAPVGSAAEATNGASAAAVGLAGHPGWAECWLRLPSVALGVAAVALTAAWASHAFGRRVGLLAALLLALSPLAIYHSQEVNQYAAMIAATPLLLLLHARLTAGARRRDWWIYGIVSAAAMATHYGLVFPLLALGIDLAWQAWRGPARRADRRRVAAYAAAMAAVVAALFALGLGARMAVPHVQPRLWGTHLAKELAYIGDVGWREIVVYFPFPFAGGPAIVVANALGVLALVGAVRLWRGGGYGPRLVGLVALTLSATYATSIVGWYPLGYRYGLFNLMPYTVLVAAGIEAAAGMTRGASARLVRVGLALLACAAFILFWPDAPWTAANPYIRVPHEDIPLVLRTIARHWRPGDRLVFNGGAAPAVRFYWRGDPASVAALAPLDGTGRGRDAVDGILAAAGTGTTWLIQGRADDVDYRTLQAALAARGLPSHPIFAAEGVYAWRINGAPNIVTPDTRPGAPDATPTPTPQSPRVPQTAAPTPDPAATPPTTR